MKPTLTTATLNLAKSARMELSSQSQQWKVPLTMYYTMTGSMISTTWSNNLIGIELRIRVLINQLLLFTKMKKTGLSWLRLIISIIWLDYSQVTTQRVRIWCLVLCIIRNRSVRMSQDIKKSLCTAYTIINYTNIRCTQHIRFNLGTLTLNLSTKLILSSVS